MSGIIGAGWYRGSVQDANPAKGHPAEVFQQDSIVACKPPQPQARAKMMAGVKIVIWKKENKNESCIHSDTK